jgi:hypothetical protein
MIPILVSTCNVKRVSEVCFVRKLLALWQKEIFVGPSPRYRIGARYSRSVTVTWSRMSDQANSDSLTVRCIENELRIKPLFGDNSILHSGGSCYRPDDKHLYCDCYIAIQMLLFISFSSQVSFLPSNNLSTSTAFVCIPIYNIFFRII